MESKIPKLKISYVNAGSHSHIVGLDELAGEIKRILDRGADPRKLTVTMVVAKEKFEIYCPKCGATWTAKLKPTLYATKNKDRDRWEYDCKACRVRERKIQSRKNLPLKNCRHCGTAFQPKRSTGLYCSDRCKTAFSRQALKSATPETRERLVEKLADLETQKQNNEKGN